MPKNLQTRLNWLRSGGFYLRAGGVWVGLIGLTHGLGHMRTAFGPEGYAPAKRAAYDAMVATVKPGAIDSTMWDFYILFSLGMGMGLLFAGLATWLVAGGDDDALKRRFAGMSALFWAIAVTVWMTASPVAGAILIGAGAVPLYALAWWMLRPIPDSGSVSPVTGPITGPITGKP